MNLTLLEAARVMGAATEGLDPTIRVTGAVVDSRLVNTGDIFFALKGEFVDGFDHVAEALRKGAGAVVVDRPADVDLSRQVFLSEPMAGLTALAGWVRDVMNPLVVGITGSTGKTSVKDLLAAILRPQMPVIAAEKSFNNELGVPLTLLRTRPDTRVVVIEMGARGPGQIAELCELARPHLGVVTNVGITHFETFGSRAAIAAAKGELVEAIPEGGAAILNADDPLSAGMASLSGELVDTLTFGLSEGAWLRADNVRIDRQGRPSFLLVRGSQKGVWVGLPVSGAHQVMNALAASAAALALGLTLADCRVGLESAEVSPWRMQTRLVGETVIVNDAYNASPTSVASALQTCSQMLGRGGCLIAVLGHMAELGSLAETEHLRIGALASSLAGRLVVVGAQAAAIAEGARQGGMTDVIEVADAKDAVVAVGTPGPGDVVLIKGSRVAALEQLSESIERMMTGV